MSGRATIVFASALTCAVATQAAAPVHAETPLVIAPTAVVAADNVIASEIGVTLLQDGGNAVDAAVGVGLALGVLNPFASGLGGGGFMVYRDGATGEVYALDFREMAPAAAHRDMYVVDGEHDRDASRYGGLAVGVPGEAAGWSAAHGRFGALPWADVIEPARALADDGFTVAPLLEGRLDGVAERLDGFPALRAEFDVDGHVARAGDHLERPGLARTLEALQAGGSAGFYEGWVAESIVAATSSAGGVLTLEDLASYEVVWREPVASSYRGHTLYGMPGPSSGGLVVAQVMHTLEHFELTRGLFEDAATAHIIMQAFAFAFADRARLLGDPDFWPVPVDRFLGPERPDEALDAYNPARTLDVEDYGPRVTVSSDHGTSHFSIVDAHGNAVACTVTVNTSFGSLVVAPESGLVLNNEMDDFAAQPGVPNAFGLVGGDANAIEPGKRPLSSMSPTIVVADGTVVGALGGSGGPMIITETVLGLVQMIDFERDAATAVSAPRFHHQWLPFSAFVEDTAPASWSEHIADFGYEVQERAFGSALQIVWRHADGWQAASDPRKHGAPAGY